MVTRDQAGCGCALVAAIAAAVLVGLFIVVGLGVTASAGAAWLAAALGSHEASIEEPFAP